MNTLEYDEIRMIDLDRWNDFIRSVYGRPYDFQQQDGCKERGIHFFGVPLKGTPYDFDRDEAFGRTEGVRFEAWLNESVNSYKELQWARNFYPSMDMIITDLYKRGLIAEGQYAINIDW